MAQPTGDLGATRAIGSRRIPAGIARTAIVRMTIAAPVAKVWGAFLTEENLANWYSPVTGEIRLGGSYKVGELATGEILECDPPQYFRVSWVVDGQPADEIELRLTSEGDSTTHLEFAHAMTATQVDWGGQVGDPLPFVGANWEFALSYLPPFLRGELPNGDGIDWFEHTPEVQAEMDRCNTAWMELVMSPAGSE